MEPVPFTVESGLLTSTMKLKRPQAKEKYLAQINQMYQELLKAKSAAGAAKL